MLVAPKLLKFKCSLDWNILLGPVNTVELNWIESKGHLTDSGRMDSKVGSPVPSVGWKNNGLPSYAWGSPHDGRRLAWDTFFLLRAMTVEEPDTPSSPESTQDKDRPQEFHGQTSTGCLPEILAQYSSFLLRPLIDARFCPLSVPVSEILSGSYPLLVKNFFWKVHPSAVPVRGCPLCLSMGERAAHSCSWLCSRSRRWIHSILVPQGLLTYLLTLWGGQERELPLRSPLDSGPILKIAQCSASPQRRTCLVPSPAEKSSLALRRERTFLAFSFPDLTSPLSSLLTIL